MGFVIGAHTIPPKTPILYVTDSNTARALQRNIINIHQFTHRKKVRKVKQGIDYALANQLEYLSQQRMNIEENSHEAFLYTNGLVCARNGLHKTPLQILAQQP